VFAAGVILFMMVTGHKPFMEATINDNIYRVIALNREQFFWHYHSRNKPNG